MHSLALKALGALTLVLSAAAASAQVPLRIVVPFAPGGPTDVAARMLAQSASTGLGRAIVIENKPGAGGSLGVRAVASSAPDGNTLLLLSHSAMRGTVAAGQQMPRLEVVAGLALAEYAVVANPSAPDIRSGRGAALAHAGGGVSEGCAEELVRKNSGLIAVPYKGAGSAVTDVVNGVAQYACVPLASVIPMVQSGRLKAIATVGPERSKVLASVPTLEELGISSAMMFDWLVLAAPAGTPADAKAQLTRAFAASVSDIAPRLQDAGMQAFSPADAAETARLQGFIDRRLAEMRP